MNKTRAKLETLFRRLTDPTVTDIEAVEACLWFRKLRLDAGDVSAALGDGAPAAPNSTGTTAPAAAPKPAPVSTSDGPMWPFTKKHAGESIAHIARTDPSYLRFMLTKELRPALVEQIKTALATAGQPMPPAAQPAAKPQPPF